MSLRRKACSACVRAKRRCDRALPACQRCSKQSLICEYHTPSSLRTPLAADGATDSIGPESRRLPQEVYTVASELSTSSTTPAFLNMVSFESDSFPLAAFDISTDTLGAFENSQQSIEHVEDPFSYTEDVISTWPVPRVETESGLLHAQGQAGDKPHDDAECRSLQTGQPNDTTTMGYLGDYDPGHIEQNPEIPRLRCVEQMWSRGQDTPRWEFCANEVLSFVRLFSRTGSAPFLVPREACSDGWRQKTPVSLIRAMGVCAAYVTADDTGRQVFEQLLEMEANAIIESSHSEYFGLDSIDSRLSRFRTELVRVQVMTIYHIICLFSTSQRMRLLAEKQEPLMISWTRQLLLRLQSLEKESGLTSLSAFSSSSFTDSIDIEDVHPFPTVDNSPYPPSLRKEEIISAYKTILISHLVHTIYTSLKYQFCRHLPELRAIPILTATLGEKTHYDGLAGPPLPPEMFGSGNRRPPKMTYIDYSDSWEEEELRCLDRKDRFTVLVLAACKGISFLNVDS